LFGLGPSYALLDARYAESPRRRAASEVARIFVSLGGGRQTEHLTTALAALDRVVTGCLVDVAAGSFSEDRERLDRIARDARNRIVIHRGAFGVRDLMLTADLAISGAGVTLCELAATATPTVAVLLAGNQQPNLDAFGDGGAAVGAGGASGADLGANIEAALTRLVRDHTLRAGIGSRGRQLVDGQGTRRVATAIMQPVG